MIYFGSGAEYDKANIPPKVKEDFFNVHVPSDDYGFSKYISALIAENADNIYDLILFGCFGKYEDWEIRFISNACAKSVNDLDITIRQNVKFDYLDVNDLVEIVRYFIEAGKLRFKRYNICTGRSNDLYSLAKLVKKASGKKIGIKIKKSGWGREYSGNNRRLIKEIGKFNFKSLPQSIKELYGWYEGNKKILDNKLLLADK